MTVVERVRLNDELSISRVVTGLWQIADMERDGRALDLDAAAAAMAEYVDAGLTTFDMADHYGSAELIAGRYLARSGRRDVQLLTKWVPAPGASSREVVRAAVQRSLDRLQTERVDLLQFHAWSYADPSYLDCLFWLQEMVEEGLIGALGLTNFDTAHLGVVLHSGIRVASNQVCHSVLDRRAAQGLTALCREHGVALLAFGALAGGLLTERWLDQPATDVDDLATWSHMKYRRLIDAAGGWPAYQAVLRAVVEVARERGVSAANVACRALLEEPGVAAVLVGARLGERAHVQDTLRVFEWSLGDAGRAALAAAQAALEPVPGDCGDEYRRPPFLTAAGDLSHHLETLPAPYSTRPGAGGRTRVLSGTPWEAMAGYCRAVRVGDRILVSGTTASHRDRTVGGQDPASQAHFVIDKIEGAIQSLGGTLEDVVRTRVFVRRIEDWEAVARVHGARFRHVLPANTLVEAKLVGADPLVEIEAEAVVG
ncbi:MAG: aldo/keto reductase [Planctomycetota bacterium]